MRFNNGINFLFKKHLELISPVREAASFSQIFGFMSTQKTHYTSLHFDAAYPPLPLTYGVMVGQSLASLGASTRQESSHSEYHCQTRNTSGLDQIRGCQLAACGQIPPATCVGLACSVFN